VIKKERKKPSRKEKIASRRASSNLKLVSLLLSLVPKLPNRKPEVCNVSRSDQSGESDVEGESCGSQSEPERE